MVCCSHPMHGVECVHKKMWIDLVIQFIDLQLALLLFLLAIVLDEGGNLGFHFVKPAKEGVKFLHVKLPVDGGEIAAPCLCHIVAQSLDWSVNEVDKQEDG